MVVLSPYKSTIYRFRRWIFTTLTGITVVVVIHLYNSAAATSKASLLSSRSQDRPAAQIRNHSYSGTTKKGQPFNNTVHLVDNRGTSNKSFSRKLRANDLSEEDICSKSCQDAVQRLRQRRLTNACAFAASKFRRRLKIWDAQGNLRADQLKRLNHLYPIDNSELIYCSVPKDGSSSWKRILLAVAGHIEDPNSFQRNVHPVFEARIKPLSKYNVSEAEKRLRTYRKFLFVREPLQRMLSLFLDKSVAKEEFPFKDDQFEGFLNYILGTPVHGMALGYPEHWAHAAYLCLPCDVRYNFIGRLETSKRDFKYILNNFVNQSFQSRQFSLTKVHKTKSTDPIIKKHYFNHVNKTTLERIYKRYELDYKIFSYDKPVVLQNTSKV